MFSGFKSRCTLAAAEIYGLRMFGTSISEYNLDPGRAQKLQVNFANFIIGLPKSWPVVILGLYGLYILIYIGLIQNPSPKKTPTCAQPWQGSTPAVSLHGGTSPHHRSDGRAWKPGTRCTIRMVGLRCFWSPKHAWIMLDHVGFTNTIHNFRQLWWDVTCLSWCRLLYIHHHSPYFKPGSWPTSVYVFHWPRTTTGGCIKKSSGSWFRFSHQPPSAPAWCSGNAPPSSKQCSRSPPAACGRKGRWMLGGWFSKNLPCLCFHVWHCLYGKDDLDWFEIVWTCPDVLNNTSGDHVWCLIHSWFHSSWTCHWRWFHLPPIGSLDPEVTPKSRQLKELKTLKIHPFDFNLWFHLLPPLRFTTLHKLQRKVHVGLAGVLVLWSKKIETYGQTPRLHAIPILAVIIYWLVVYLMYTYPSEKYESQLSWLFPIYGKIKKMFQTTSQYIIPTEHQYTSSLEDHRSHPSTIGFL